MISSRDRIVLKPRHIPNIISSARILMVYPVIAAMVAHDFTPALLLFTLAGLSDGVDGFLAKHYGWQSRLGSYLDPVADKLLLVASYTTLASLGQIPIWLAMLVIGRDLIIFCGAVAYYFMLHPFDGQPSLISKLNTLCQLVLVFVLLLGAAGNVTLPLALPEILISLVAITTLGSGALYVRDWGMRYHRARRGNHKPDQTTVSNTMTQTAELSSRFRRIGLITIVAVYALILVGGIVRASGSGMGCPDWPTCFGKLIPPTEESQLPPDYHERYVGYGDTTFNAVKTWTEYVNRLLGVSIGILILTTLIRAMPYRKLDPALFRGALTVFLLVGFQGWLGSRVVASELKPALITAHMIVAFLIVILLIYTVTRSQREQLSRVDTSTLPTTWRRVLLLAMGMTLLQVAMGTQIRETVDGITNAAIIAERGIWRESFPIIFYVHRSFSSIILFTNLWLTFRLIRNLQAGTPLRSFGYLQGGLVIAAILSGVSLDRLGFPAVVQPVHLLLANLIFGCQFFLYTATGYGRLGNRG